MSEVALPNLAKSRALVDAMRRSLPSSVDAATLGVVSKAPYKILCIREALIWRNEELARSACDALERGDVAAGIVLTRSTSENAALLWYLKCTLENRSKGGVNDDKLMKMLLGDKSNPEMPNPVHVLDTLRNLDALIPGVLKSYEYLSEYAHPNWHGVALLYSRIDAPNFITYFGPNLRGGRHVEDAANLLLASLELFEHAYNAISDQMPTYLSELEKL